ncbi:MAG: type IV secretion system protein [Brachybacterium sp.]|uniref:type IV secretion system protein n=1 Tax=Brachybacterium sp. TaxID=1891286 RepID=UPI00264A4029|nr:type IV secretion system protein [Brachybacterium sp.]MDN5685863.1 type IV secretion system protein [Brachybacterium sp.]
MGENLGGLADGVGDLLGKGVKTAGEAAVDGAVGSPAADVAGQAARDSVGAALSSQAEKFMWDFAQNAVDGTQVVFHYVIDLLLKFSAPNITGEFIYTMGGRIFYISLPLIVLFAVIRIIADSLRARALAGAQAAFLGAAGSVLGTVALLPLTSLAVRAVDAVADGMLTATLQDGDQFVDDVMTAIVQFGTVVGNKVAGEEVSGPVVAWAVPVGGAMATALICCACIAVLLFSCFIVGAVLVARNMLLYLVTVIGPLCLSGLAWEPTRRWASIWLGWMVALIFTKLAIVIAIGLGVLAIAEPGITGEEGDVLAIFATVLAGILMLILAMFMPLACFALFGFMGEAGVRELSEAAGGAQGVMKSVGESALQSGQTAKGRLGSVLEKATGGGGSSSGMVPAPSGGDDTGSTEQTGPADGATTGGSNSGSSAAGSAIAASESGGGPQESGTEQTSAVPGGGEETSAVPGGGEETSAVSGGGEQTSAVPGDGDGDGAHQYSYGAGSQGPDAGGADVPDPGGPDADPAPAEPSTRGSAEPYSWEQPGEGWPSDADVPPPDPAGPDAPPPMDPVDPPDDEGRS